MWCRHISSSNLCGSQGVLVCITVVVVQLMPNQQTLLCWLAESLLTICCMGA